MLDFVYVLYRIVFGRRIFYKFNKLLYSLSLRGMGILNFKTDESSGEAHFLKQYVSGIEDCVIFDVGANVGDYTRNARSVSANAKIYSFEPHPATFKKLLQNTEQLTNIKAFNVGIGNSDGLLKLYDYADQDGSAHASLYKEVIEGIHKGRAVEHEVKVIALDTFVTEHKIEKVHLLKIDTEGHEMAVLQGIQQFIRANKVNLIHFEFNEMNIVSRVFFKDFWDFLPNYNFYRMLPNGLAPIKNYSPVFCEIFAYQNIVAILKS